MTDFDAEFRNRVLDWVKTNVDDQATTILEVRGYGSDWAGDTEHGWRSEFEVTVRTDRGHLYLEGEELYSLWKAVVR